MVRDIGARVCGIATARDRFDCLFRTSCSWLATLSLVCMTLFTLAAIDKILVGSPLRNT
jgi:hypothetical protein